MSEDKAIHTLYEKLKTGNFMCVVPYGDKGRYATYYAEDRLYLVFDLWYHGIFLVEAKSPRDAIDQARYITMMIGIVLTESERRVSDGR